MTKDEFLREVADSGFTKTGESEYASDINNESHTHDFAFRALVLSGEFKLTVGETVSVVRPGEQWSLEANVTHAEEVIGEAPVKFVYAVR